MNKKQLLVTWTTYIFFVVFIFFSTETIVPKEFKFLTLDHKKTSKKLDI